MQRERSCLVDQAGPSEHALDGGGPQRRIAHELDRCCDAARGARRATDGVARPTRYDPADQRGHGATVGLASRRRDRSAVVSGRQSARFVGLARARAPGRLAASELRGALQRREGAASRPRCVPHRSGCAACGAAARAGCDDGRDHTSESLRPRALTPTDARARSRTRRAGCARGRRRSCCCRAAAWGRSPSRRGARRARHARRGSA
jgi:hypothetical protein